MRTLNHSKIRLFTAIFLGFCAISQSGAGLPIGPHLTNPYAIQQSPFGNLTAQSSLPQSMNIQWPTNSINLSQLQNLLNQNPSVGQFNLQFPNQTNWGVTPNSIQSLAGMVEQSASAVGYTGKLPDMAFSSIASAVSSSGLPQMLINPKGDVQGQLTDIMRNMRYHNLDLSDSLPDWLKRICLAVYDFVYNTFEMLGSKVAGLIGR